MRTCPHCHKEIKPKSRKSEENKTFYSECVKMKPAEYNKLIEVYGYKQTANMIFTLDTAIPNQQRKPYKDHYRAILAWVVKEIKAVPILGKNPNPLLKEFKQQKQSEPELPPVRTMETRYGQESLGVILKRSLIEARRKG